MVTKDMMKNCVLFAVSVSLFISVFEPISNNDSYSVSVSQYLINSRANNQNSHLYIRCRYTCSILVVYLSTQQIPKIIYSRAVLYMPNTCVLMSTSRIVQLYYICTAQTRLIKTQKLDKQLDDDLVSICFH